MSSILGNVLQRKLSQTGKIPVSMYNPSIKQFQVIQREVLLLPDEINDTYVDINKDFQMNMNVYNGLINKAQF